MIDSNLVNDRLLNFTQSNSQQSSAPQLINMENHRNSNPHHSVHLVPTNKKRKLSATSNNNFASLQNRYKPLQWLDTTNQPQDNSTSNDYNIKPEQKPLFLFTM